MGGVLSLLMSTRLDVKGVVAMSTPYDMPVKYPAWELRSPVYLYPTSGRTRELRMKAGLTRKVLRGHISYPLNPVRSAAELEIMLERMRSVLPKVNVPVLLVHSKNDNYVPADSMPRIHERLGTPDKQMIWVSGSGHVITA